MDFYEQLQNFLTQAGANGKRAAVPQAVLDALFAQAQTRSPNAAAVAVTAPEIASAPPAPTESAPAAPVAVAKPVSCATPPDLSHAYDLAQLAKQCATCHSCALSQHRTQMVFGEGAPDAELMFIGEGPGQEEDEQGRPFVGPAGQLLDKMITAMQFDRKQVYIANIVKCRPPGNRVPNPEEAAACIGYLKKQIELIHPKVLVLLGGTPLKYLFNLSGITKHRGQWLEYEKIPVMPTFHPAYLLRDQSQKRYVWSDLKAVMGKLGKPL